MFLKRKRNGTIKERGCADGRKQRAYTSKEDASALTVAIELVLLTCVIDADIRGKRKAHYVGRGKSNYVPSQRSQTAISV